MAFSRETEHTYARSGRGESLEVCVTDVRCKAQNMSMRRTRIYIDPVSKDPVYRCSFCLELIKNTEGSSGFMWFSVSRDIRDTRNKIQWHTACTDCYSGIWSSFPNEDPMYRYIDSSILTTRISKIFLLTDALTDLFNMYPGEFNNIVTCDRAIWALETHVSLRSEEEEEV